MSNPPYPARVRRVNSVGSVGSTGSTASAPPASNVVDADDVDELDDDDYLYEDDIEFEDAAPAGMFASRGRRTALLGAMLSLVLVVGVIAWLLASTPPEQPKNLVVGINVGNIAPDFTLVDVATNQPLQLSSLRGKPVLVNFWGTWCPPCRAEMPEMQKVYNKYDGQIAMLGVSMAPRDTPDLVKSFVGNAKYTWTFIHDADYSVANTYVVNSVPSSYFIDKNGVIRARHIGAMNSTQMEGYLARAQVR